MNGRGRPGSASVNFLRPTRKVTCGHPVASPQTGEFAASDSPSGLSVHPPYPASLTHTHFWFCSKLQAPLFYCSGHFFSLSLSLKLEPPLKVIVSHTPNPHTPKSNKNAKKRRQSNPPDPTQNVATSTLRGARVKLERGSLPNTLKFSSTDLQFRHKKIFSLFAPLFEIR